MPSACRVVSVLLSHIFDNIYYMCKVAYTLYEET